MRYGQRRPHGAVGARRIVRILELVLARRGGRAPRPRRSSLGRKGRRMAREGFAARKFDAASGASRCGFRSPRSCRRTRPRALRPLLRRKRRSRKATAFLASPRRRSPSTFRLISATRPASARRSPGAASLMPSTTSATCSAIRSAALSRGRATMGVSIPSCRRHGEGDRLGWAHASSPTAIRSTARALRANLGDLMPAELHRGHAVDAPVRALAGAEAARRPPVVPLRAAFGRLASSSSARGRAPSSTRPGAGRNRRRRPARRRPGLSAGGARRSAGLQSQRHSRLPHRRL